MLTSKIAFSWVKRIGGVDERRIGANVEKAAVAKLIGFWTRFASPALPMLVEPQ